MNVVLHPPAAESPEQWSWCADCAGTGLIHVDPAEPAASALIEEDCWTCRGLGIGIGAQHIL